MAIVIDTYKITDPPNKLYKTTPESTKITLTNVDPLTPCDVLNPSLICVYTSGLAAQNYAKIAAFGNRYYFIDNVSLLDGQRAILKLSVDPLMTYADDIVKCTGVCLRTEQGATYIPDNKFPILTNKRQIVLDNFDSTPFTRSPSYPYILTTIGGDT